MATAAQVFLDILATKKVRTWVPTTSQKQSVIRVDYQVWKNLKSHLPTYSLGPKLSHEERAWD